VRDDLRDPRAQLALGRAIGQPNGRRQIEQPSIAARPLVSVLLCSSSADGGREDGVLPRVLVILTALDEP
jgi:hypothetical protein